MAKMPGAKQRPLAAVMTQPRMRSHKVVCIHTMVGSLNGTESMFKQGGYAGTESHFGTGGDGEIRQWVDTAFSADANYLGSRDVISIENADHGPEFPRWNTAGDNVPPFTDAQIEANAQIIAWVHKTHGTPIVRIPNTRPSSRGVGYHAQGVPGNGLVSGGVQWSKARGKVCPGRRRIAQIPQIIRRANQIAGGNSIVAIEEGIFDMALRAADSRTEKRSIGRGKEGILRTRSKNTNSFLASVKTNETVLVDAHLRVSGLREGQVAEAWLRLGEYVKTTGKSHSRYNYPRVTIHGRAGGGDVHVSVPLVDTVRMSPKRKGDLRLYLVVKNVSGDECVVESVKYHILGD